MRSGRHLAARRALLRFLAGSPLVAGFSSPLLAAIEGLAGSQQVPVDAWGDAATVLSAAGASGPVITAPEQAINVFDLQAAAEATLPPAHYGYIATGVDGEETQLANRAGYAKLQLRPRRLVDVSRIDMSVDLFGERWNTPIVIAPCGSQRAFHEEGEIATARAAGARGHLQILSTVSSTGVEDVIGARGAPVWYQLYPSTVWAVTQGLVRRAQAAGCPTVVLTVDLPASNRETLARFARRDDRPCEVCHEPPRPKPMFEGLDNGATPDDVGWRSWDFIARFRDITPMRLLLKGLVTAEDAELAVRYGADGIIVSNHGGRAEPSGRATIESLSEVVAAVGGRMPVLVDGGIRRGADAFKALALGARAVMIGRPYLWGLGAFGQPGVERVLELLTRELEIAMKVSGTPTIADITPRHVFRSE